MKRESEDYGGKTRLGPSASLSGICHEASHHLTEPQFLHLDNNCTNLPAVLRGMF